MVFYLRNGINDIDNMEIGFLNTPDGQMASLHDRIWLQMERIDMEYDNVGIYYCMDTDMIPAGNGTYYIPNLRTVYGSFPPVPSMLFMDMCLSGRFRIFCYARDAESAVSATNAIRGIFEEGHGSDDVF